MEDRKLEEIIKRIDLEIDSVNAGHKAFKESENNKSFSNEYLENCYGTYDDHDDIEFVDESGSDHSSTFDEANYSILSY
jgi:hypothetical protein